MTTSKCWNYRWPKGSLLALLLGCIGFLSGCAAHPTDADNRGSCALTCSEPKAPGSDFELQPLFNEEVTTSCTSALGGPSLQDVLTVPMQVSFRIVRKAKGPAATGGGAGGGDDGATGLQTIEDDLLGIDQPLEGIGFQPYVVGERSLEKTHEDLKTVDESGNEVAEEAKYTGVATPRSEWCSDKCGVMTFEFWPMCRSGGVIEFTAGIQTGGVRSTPIQFTIADGSL